MKHIFLALMLFCETGRCLSKTEAVELSKLRIDTLSKWASGFAGECFMNEEHCGVEGKSQIAVLNYIRHEPSKAPIQISYDSGKDKFFIDGAIRIAKTGSDWGTPIVFNEDLLAKVETDSYAALGFFETLGILIHELGHHQTMMMASIGLPQLEHSELDTVAMHAVSYLQDRTRKISVTSDDLPGLGKDDQLTVYFIDREANPGIRQIWGQTFVDSRSGVAEISKQISLNVQCPLGYDGDRVRFNGKPTYASYRQVSAPVISQTTNGLSISQKVGSASVLCVDDFMGVYDIFDGFKDGVLTLNFSNSKRRIEFERGSFKATRDQAGQL